MVTRRVTGPDDDRLGSDDPDLWVSPEEQAELVALVDAARAGDAEAIRALGRWPCGSIYRRLALGARVHDDAAEVAVRSVAAKRRLEAVWAWAKVRGVPFPVAQARFGLEDTYPGR